jgi:midasin
LKKEGQEILEKLMHKHLLGGKPIKGIMKPPPAPENDTHVLIEQFWVEAGELERVDPEGYVVTDTVKSHLSNLARAVLLRRHPILLQGPTSAGKTSIIEYLAKRTGHRFMRINNHSIQIYRSILART